MSVGAFGDGDDPTNRNHRFTSEEWLKFTSEPVAEEELNKLRDEAAALLKEHGSDRFAWRSCWVCNSAHTKFLGRPEEDLFVLNCFSCGRYYWRDTDITIYGEPEEKS